ncbi:hypothetical protein GF324_03810 [bacterium]|nr:hypothetical protein [bacterium]
MTFTQRQTLLVARWEFRRFFKWKDGLILFGFMMAGLFVFQLFGSFLEDKPPEGAKIVVQASTDEFPVPDDSDAFTYRSMPEADRDELAHLLQDDEADAALIVHAPDSLELLVEKKPAWIDFLEAELTEARKLAGIEPYGLTSERLDELLASVDVELVFLSPDRERTSKGELMVALFLVLMMVMGIWVGGALTFVSITGEKQNRITEYILSAVTPQVWIDGKILGMAGVGVAYVVFFLGLLTALASLVNAFAFFFIPIEWSIHVSSILMMAVVLALGYLMWFTFIGAIAATVNDPNTSNRGMVMMLPMVPLLLALGALKNPDSVLMTVLGMVPFTAPTVFPARLALGDPAFWEFLTAVTGLVVMTWILRNYAGKVFAMAILMTGKEPTWAEMRQWIKRV